MPHSTYLPERMGTATVSPTGEFEAGSFQEFTFTYTAGYFGIDDTGSIKIVHRFASDMGRPQFTDPKGWNYTTVEASNDAVLQVEYDAKRNIRPWDKTLFIRVVRGFLREGDQIIVRFGDRRQGSPGIRAQTFHEPTFEFRVLVDAIATYNYVELPVQPYVSIVAGPPVLYKAILPTLKRVGEPFYLGFKGDDRWGNPSHRVAGAFRLQPSRPIEALPETLAVNVGRYATKVGPLYVTTPGDVTIDVMDAAGKMLCRSNPLRVAQTAELVHYWADLHGQSEETIGTNSARELIEFARDRAFLDAMSHQGNDFQITTPFWQDLNRLTAEFNRDGEFVIYPGYEWSGNTGLGGDRNVLFRDEGRTIHRSSHALLDDLSDVETDANSAGDLFKALKNENCVVFAHIGGRYADIKIAHDSRVEKSVEVHSDWGTFEWLLGDAFEQGYRVGIVANSDGHKGRHGASHPGASLFGAYGGLTCLLATALTRDALFDAMRRRHHYATTGNRLLMDVAVELETPGKLYDQDPNVDPAAAAKDGTRAIMGDIVRTDRNEVTFDLEVWANAPIERIALRNGKAILETFRPYTEGELGRRIRIIWEGSEYRGRGRQTIWDGSATLEDNEFTRAEPINFWNLDKRLERVGERSLRWQALTTGGFGGVDLDVRDAKRGVLVIDTPLIKERILLERIGMDDVVFANGGINRQIRVFRLPERNDQTHMQRSCRVKLNTSGDNALYICVTTEDGHLAWSSPIYLFR
jgi:Protein of unknown function (DUF3604)